jgi:hypothetical protein
VEVGINTERNRHQAMNFLESRIVGTKVFADRLIMQLIFDPVDENCHFAE